MTATTVRERPILFTGENVRAILDGRKTMTRRVVTPQGRYGIVRNGRAVALWSYCTEFGQAGAPLSPHYEVGMMLWVREKWAVNDEACLRYGTGERKWFGDVLINRIRNAHNVEHRFGEWRPSIFMPRWASRLTLEVTAVRVERLQEIRVEDIIAEGIQSTLREHDAVVDLREKWRHGWDTINGHRAPWASNPWVFVIEFKPVEVPR